MGVFVPRLLSGAPRYLVRTWGVEHGIPHNAVTAILQTRDGYLWIGTYAGLARFDGVRFFVFDTTTTEQMPSSRVTSLFEDSNGNMWVGFEGGEVACFRARRFHIVNWEPKWETKIIRNLGSDGTGEVWAVNTEGLLARVKDGLVLMPRRGSTRGMVNAVGTEKTIWVARNGFVSALQCGTLELVDFDGRGGESYIQGICPSHDGGLWVVHEGQVKKWNGNNWVETWGIWQWGQAPLSAFVETKSGLLAAGTTEQGLFLLLPGGQALHFGSTNGLPSDWIRSLYEDREGNLWVGTGQGLAMLRPSNIGIAVPPDQWRSRPLTAVAAGSDGSIWVGTEGAGLYRLKSGHWSRLGIEEGLPSEFVWSIAEDLKGRVWVGTWGSGIHVHQGTNFTMVPGLDIKVPVLAILHTGPDESFIGTSKGLLHYKAGAVTELKDAYGKELGDVRAIVRDAEGRVWCGTLGGGLVCFKNGTSRRFRKSDGLASDFVQCLFADTDGTLWIGTHGGGVSAFKNGRFTTITMQHGLANNFITWIENDNEGNLWLASHGGLMRITKGELQTFFINGAPVKCTVYTRSDGLPTRLFCGGMQPAGCKTPDGKLWFPTSMGLVVVDPKNTVQNTVPPSVVIEEVRVDGVPVPLPNTSSEPLRIGPGLRQIEFHYTGLSFAVPEKVQFKYRLTDLSSEWLGVLSKRSAVFNYLPPGKYTFHVAACNNDGLWNESGAQVAFIVLPRFWQTIWFRTAIGLTFVILLSSAIWFTIRHRTHRRLKLLEQERDREQERARIARDIHDHLGVYITQVTMLSDPTRNATEGEVEASIKLGRIHKIGRELIQAMDGIVWVINPRHDTFESLAAYLTKFAQDFLGEIGIRCRLDIPLHLPAWEVGAEIRHNLFLSFKEALNNIVKHAGASEVRISITLLPNGFELALEDNGRGFTPVPSALATNVPSYHTAERSGLLNMSQRMSAIGGECKVESTPGKGTRVAFVIRMPHLS